MQRSASISQLNHQNKTATCGSTMHITSNNRSFTNDQNGVSTKTIKHVFLDCLGSIMHLHACTIDHILTWQYACKLSQW